MFQVLQKGILIFFSTIVPLLSFAQQAASFDDFVVRRFFHLELQLIKTTPGFTPPVASRALGYTGLVLYEAVVPNIADYQSADGILNQLGPNVITDPTSSLHPPTAAANALGTIIDSLYGNASVANKTLIRSLKDSFNTVFQTQISATLYNQSVGFGTTIAQEIFAFSATDGGHKGYASNFPPSYMPPTGVGLWTATPPVFAPIPLQPYWGYVRPFVADNSAAQALLVPPPTFSTDTSSAFYKAGLEVFQTVNNLTVAQSNIAFFWADGGGSVTPPGHSISILNQISAIENLNLEQSVLVYSKLSMSQMDAFINCWKSKYQYNLLRPVSYIRQTIDSTWSSLIATPPFPEYGSGHSTQSGAFREVLSGVFGPTYQFTDNTNGTLYGGPRTYTSFDQVAQEAAMSRLFGGIHYRFGNENGLLGGEIVGKNINKLFATALKKNPLADAAVKVSLDKSSALIGETIVVKVILKNEGLTNLTQLEVTNVLPASLQFVSSETDFGTYNSTTGVWIIDTVYAGDAYIELFITALVIGDGVPFLTAEVTAMAEPDLDSTPNDQDKSADDFATACLSVPVKMCNPNVHFAAPAGYTSYTWYRSTDSGATYNIFATTQEVDVTTPGYYLFGVENAVLGDCGNQLCCPIIVESFCCPNIICLPVTIIVNK